jgi:hypothetical protein
MNWLQDMSDMVVGIEGLTQESVAHIDVEGFQNKVTMTFGVLILMLMLMT